MKKTILQLIACLVPTILACYYLPTLPMKIPIHFDIEGQANDFGSKYFIFLGAALPWIFWIQNYLIKRFDPKKRIDEMGGKYGQFTFIMIILMSLLGVFMILTMSNGHMKFDPQFIFIFLGFFFLVLGNYTPSMKPNYFIGIRTPWTLDNEQVWKKTHQIGGYVYAITGIVFLTFAFLFRDPNEFKYILFAAVLATVGLYVFSFWYFHKIK